MISSNIIKPDRFSTGLLNNFCYFTFIEHFDSSFSFNISISVGFVPLCALSSLFFKQRRQLDCLLSNVLIEPLCGRLRYAFAMRILDVPPHDGVVLLTTIKCFLNSWVSSSHETNSNIRFRHLFEIPSSMIKFQA